MLCGRSSCRSVFVKFRDSLATRMRKHLNKIRIILSCGLVGFVCFSIFNNYYNKKIFRNILNIQKLPDSLKIKECKSPFIPTDAITTCYAEILPSDFEILKNGYEFIESTINAHSHEYLGLGIKVGAKFQISNEFIVEPKTFIHGGHVKLLSNAGKSRVILDYYEE